MAWIHPITSGEYRILFITSTGITATSASISTYHSHAQGDITNWTNLGGIGLTSTDWFAWGSTLTDDAKDQGAKSSPVTGDVPVYTPSTVSTGVLMETALVDSSGTVSLPKHGDGATPVYPYTFPWIGSEYNGVKYPSGYELGGSNARSANGEAILLTSWKGRFQNLLSNEKTGVFPLYAISPVITTVTGSISGTVPTTDDYVIFVGATTLTADVNFGGTVDLKAALDVSQTPTITGDFFIDVGVGGTVTDIPVKIQDSGTGNVFAGNVGSGIQVRN